MQRGDAGVGISADEQDGRVFGSRFHVVIRRVRAEHVELRRILGRTVFGYPEPRHEKILIPQHVQERNATHDGSKQIGTLSERSSDEQSSVTASRNRQFFWIGVLLG